MGGLIDRLVGQLVGRSVARLLGWSVGRDGGSMGRDSEGGWEVGR